MKTNCVRMFQSQFFFPIFHQMIYILEIEKTKLNFGRFYPNSFPAISRNKTLSSKL